MTDQETASFTGRTGKRKTRPIVRFNNAAARFVITLGGIGTIAAVLGVLVFLIYVTAPLFTHGSISDQKYLTLKDNPAHSSSVSTSPAAIGVDEYLTMGWSLDQSGKMHTFTLGDGQTLSEQPIFPRDVPPTFLRYSPLDGTIMVGLSDGRVRLGSISFKTSFLDNDEVPTDLRDMKQGDILRDSGGTIERTVQGQYRRQDITIKLGDPMKSGTKQPIVLFDAITTDRGPIFAVMGENGELRIDSTREIHNMLTGKITQKVKSGKVPYEPQADGVAPKYLLLTGLGDNIFLIWEDGRFQRFVTRNVHDTQLVETGNFLNGVRDGSGNAAVITAAELLTGRRTLLIGDSSGRLTAWFRTKPNRSPNPDGITMEAGHVFTLDTSPVTTIAPSPRTRMVSVGYEDGSLRTIYLTSEKTLAQVELQDHQAVRSAAIAPKENAIFAFDGSRLYSCMINPGYPEASFREFFLPVWYEEAPKPELVWQSSSGTDDFEAKLSMIPLIFGTLKATFFSMIFAVPLALLAAIYTSEFMKPRSRDRIKPIVELMASLPSVVLGYFAAIIFAPFIESVVPFALCLFVTIPLAFLLGAYLLQLVPYQINLRLNRYRLLLFVIALPIGVILAYIIGPEMERWLFAGNIRIWLSGQIGTGTGGWFIVLLPLVIAIIAISTSRLFNPWFRGRLMDASRATCALADLVKFLILAAGTFVIALALSSLLNHAGFDPRGSIMGTFVQRNAFVVGIVMGFAVIPIIYTIADDALSAVPGHLRSAALGSGATPWQTAIIIIVPAAMSGLFSACMIGLGRAVGETMIVLMAAGNVPLLDFNPFNGFRTLAANIAVEIPEAVRNSTHYRTLFFAALLLFIMTFIINTIAEMIRIHFRKRAFEL